LTATAAAAAFTPFKVKFHAQTFRSHLKNEEGRYPSAKVNHNTTKRLYYLP
jgi:hypothetical protein